MSNYPDDIRSYDHHPQSPFYDDGGYEDAVSDAFQDALTGDNTDLYFDMFNTMESEEVILLLRDVHAGGCPKKLLSRLDKMLEEIVKETIYDNLR